MSSRGLRSAAWLQVELSLMGDSKLSKYPGLYLSLETSLDKVFPVFNTHPSLDRTALRVLSPCTRPFLEALVPLPEHTPVMVTSFIAPLPPPCYLPTFLFPLFAPFPPSVAGAVWAPPC